MAQNNHCSKAFVPGKPVHAVAPAPPAVRDHNHPVPLETFERERMGVAAKE
jgi:hypothetical protein